jgi:hypothetical protein
MELFVEN